MQEHDPTAIDPDEKPLEGGDLAAPSPPQEGSTSTPDSPPRSGVPEDAPPPSPPPTPQPDDADENDGRGQD